MIVIDVVYTCLSLGTLFISYSVSLFVFFFYNQNTAYEIRISDWSSDVCSSDLYGLGNALRNISEPVNFLNFLLQFKIGKAAETLGRFVVNTTFGVGGLVDVAKTKPFNLPYRRNGFANTLGFYGVEPGPYFYLPLVGPTTLRDMARSEEHTSDFQSLMRTSYA